MALDFGFALSCDSRIGEYTMKKRIFALLLALAMGLSLMACSAPAAEDPSPSPSADPSDTPSASTEPAIKADLTQDVLTFATGDLVSGDPLLTVNGTPVSNNLMLYWLFYCCSYYEQQLYYYGLPLSMYADAIVNEAYNMATYYTVLARKAEEMGCILTDEQLENLKADTGMGGEEHEQRKALYGLSDEDLMVIYSLSDFYDNLSEVVISEPTEEDLNNYVYQVKHILIATAASAADGVVTLNTGSTVEYAGTAEEYNAEALARAEAILAEIRAAEDLEATFDALMHEHSEDGRDADGNLGSPDGYTATPGKMVPEFEQTAFSTAVGEVSEPVKSTYGYHIILRGEVEDLDSYADDWKIAQMDEQISVWTSEADVVKSDAISAENVVELYERFAAWQMAYATEHSETK